MIRSASLLLLMTALLLPAGASAGDAAADLARTRTTLEQAFPDGGVLQGPLRVGSVQLASLAVDLDALDEAGTLPLGWSDGEPPVGFAEGLSARVTSIPATLFSGGSIRLSLDLTARPDRPLVLICEVPRPATSGQPRGLACSISMPHLPGEDEARRYLRDPSQVAQPTICRCDTGGQGLWTLTLPVDREADRQLAGPRGETWTLGSQAIQTRISAVGGEILHSAGHILHFEGPRPLRFETLVEGDAARSLSGSERGGTPSTLTGRLLQATGQGTVGCAIHDPPPEPSGDMFDSQAPQPTWRGTLTCGTE